MTPAPAQSGLFIRPIRLGNSGGSFNPKVPPNFLYYDGFEVLRTT